MSLNIPNSGAYGRWTCSSATILGNSTYFAVVRRTVDAGSAGYVMSFQTSSSLSLSSLGFRTTSDLFFSNSPLSSATTMTGKIADGWFAMAVTKGSGTVAPRFHKYVYSTGVATHENGDTAVADTASVGAGASLLIGRVQTGIASTGLGDYAVAAVFTRVFSDQEFVTAAQSVGAMRGMHPNRGFWLFDHAAGQTDESSIGSTSVTQTGLVVGTTNPPLGYGRRIQAG